MKISLTRKTKEPGLPPGTLVHIGEKKAKKVTLDLIQYNEKVFEESRVKDMEDLVRARDNDKVSWINVNGLHDADIMERLSSLFSVHPLVMEDIMNTRQRPKSEVNPDHIFLVMKMIKKNHKGKHVIEQISLILGKGYVITFQERKGDVFDTIRDRIRTRRGKIRKMRADYLAYALLDSTVDKYFPVIEEIGDSLISIESELDKNVEDITLKRIHRLKGDLIQVRKSIWPMREVINQLMREDTSLIGDDVKPYLKDVYDHVIILRDNLDTNRDIASGTRDLYMSLVSNRMNEIMKVLTIIATVFIPLSFITGLYGMNFNSNSSPLNMPELDWYWGYPAAITVMTLMVVGMIIYFKRKRWM